MACLIIEQEPGQAAGQFGLADAGRAQEHEAADRPLRVFEPGPAAPDSLGDGQYGFFLVDHALMNPVFHMDQFLSFAFHHLGDRNAGPFGDQLGDILFIDGLANLVCFSANRLWLAVILTFDSQPFGS